MYTGATAKLKYYSDNYMSEIAYISNFSIDVSKEYLESITLGKNTKKAYPSYISWSASADGAVSFESKTSHKALYDAMINSQKITFYFYLDDDYDRLTALEGQGYIDSMSIGISAEDKGTISISVKGEGKLIIHTEKEKELLGYCSELFCRDEINIL